MGLAKYEIELDNPEKVFFPGQAVTGKLLITITNRPKLLVQPGITLQCWGDEEVNFSPPGSSPLKSDDKYARNEYFNFTAPFMVPPVDGTPLVLPVGEHKFPFSFKLPVGIPSSYEGRYGRIQYIMISLINYLTDSKGQICRIRGGRPCNGPHTSTNIKICVFNVNSLVDLNTIPQARMNASSTDSKTLGFWCCKSGPITAKTWINQVGYAPGQTLYFNAKVENTSGKQMRGSRVQLVEDSIFKTRNGATKRVTRVISEKNHGPFNDSDEWSMEPIAIPFVAPSTLPNCNIIHVNYRVQLMIQDGGFTKKNLTLSIPILIGNIPLRPVDASSDGSAVGAMTPSSLGNGSNDQKLKASSITDYPNLPQPRYEQGHAFSSTNGRSNSTSKYVTYAI